MKTIFSTISLLLTFLIFSQKIQKNDLHANLGLGFAESWGIPVYAGIDYGASKDISVGLQAAYASKNKGTWFGLGANANYHFNSLFKMTNKWDIYAGATVGYNIFSYDDDFNNGKNKDNSDFGFGGQLGFRYFITNKFGLNLEFGGNNITSEGKFGVTFKL